VKKQAVTVKQLDWLLPGFRFLDLGICQCHYTKRHGSAGWLPTAARSKVTAPLVQR
jgi:hypothetical protein